MSTGSLHFGTGFVFEIVEERGLCYVPGIGGYGDI
jgi:hypothetical protein